MRLIKTIFASALLLSAAAANANVIITDGNVSLGVNELGNLNVDGNVADIVGATGVGLRYIAPNGNQYEATWHGCECEGWGVAAGDGSFTGYANDASGTAGLIDNGFSSTATTATSDVSTTGGEVNVTHEFALASETDNLFRVTVTIENTSGADIANLLYRRTFDWDTSPTPYNEYVSIQGTALATAVTSASSNGFCDSNPLVGCSGTYSGDFLAAGPSDHGANFDFDFGLLAAGESFTFDIFYGGADNQTDALAALGAVGAEVYSMGWSGVDADQDGWEDVIDGRRTPTFMFGFSGVGGIALPNPDTAAVPEPTSIAILALGMLGLVSTRRRLMK